MYLKKLLSVIPIILCFIEVSAQQNLLDPNNNVGIGTLTPKSRLHVVDNFRNYYVNRGIPGTTNNWTKSIRINNGTTFEFGGIGKSYGVGASGPNLYHFSANADGSGAASYYMIVDGTTGNMGIGSVPSPNHKLVVEGAVSTRKIKVQQTTWADFVFGNDYKLPDLFEVAGFIEKKKHLPGIPSEMEVKQDGIDLGEMNKLLLQKIEELTLYMIEFKKENESLKKRIASLEENKR